jgi:tRNA-2-methylthio-N6-dimethylallyladenosine synthase
VGGCVAQQVGDAILKRFPQVDFVFGTHNVRWVPAMAAAAELGERESRTDETRSQARFDLPSLHPEATSHSSRRAFVTVMEGCDMFCTFCIVPQTRGREISRRSEEIVAEVTELAASGVCEITLLGQTVNAYGRHDLRRGSDHAADVVSFADLLRRLDAIPGLERIRYTSPHPLFFDDELAACHRELESLCPHVHLPLQSGSDEVLQQMRRRYGRQQYCDIAAGLREARPDLAITTDIIVGFPGETEAQFIETLDVVDEVRFVDSYMFKYSPRPGTVASGLAGEVSSDEAQRRLAALQAKQRELTVEYHRSRVGQRTQILIEGSSRRPGQVRGRDPFHRVVNVDALEAAGGSVVSSPGAMLDVEIVDATPHSLIGTPIL